MKIIAASLVCLALCLVGAPALADPAQGVKREGTRFSCSSELYLDAPARAALETECFGATNGVVRRDGDKVIIKLANGSETTLDDNATVPDTSEDWRRVILTDFDAAHGLAVIYQAGYETAQTSLMDLKTGDTIDIGWSPHFSPSGNRLASVVNGPADEHDFELIVIDVAQSPFKTLAVVKPGTLKRFGKVKAEAPTIDFMGWKGETRIQLRLSDGNDVEYARLALAADAKGKWTVVRAK